MSNLRIYIDGTWLFKVAIAGTDSKGETVFKRFLSQPQYFSIDFNKFNSLLLNHVKKYRPECTDIAECYFVTSLFKLPDDFDSWIGEYISDPYGNRGITVTQKDIDDTKKNIARRKKFSDATKAAGYDPDYIFSVPFRKWMLLNMRHRELRYQEKQVDTTVVALLVRDAIEHPKDCFALVAGDADILPAVQVAYSDYTKNIFSVFTSPDEREGKDRQTSFKYTQFQFDIDPLILQNHVGEIMDGGKGKVYRCTECGKYFTILSSTAQQDIASGKMQARCKICRER